MRIDHVLSLFSISIVKGVTGGASSDISSKSSTFSTLPKWIKEGTDKETMATNLEIARQRHAKAVQKARDSYYYFPAGSSCRDGDGSFALDSLNFDEYTITAAGRLPDFGDELDRDLFVTSARTPLFTSEECAKVISDAELYFKLTHGGKWTTLPSGQYDVAGFWIRDVPAVHEWFNQMVKERLFPLLMKKFPDFIESIEDLCVDNAYLFKYTPETGRRTDVHTDSGCLSFTIALNSMDDFTGGGTWFEGLEKTGNEDDASEVIEMNTGQCTVRPGGVRHCGHAVTSGTRYIIGGFCMNAKKVEQVRMLIGVGSEEASKNPKKARDALQTAIMLNPDFVGPYSHLADILTKNGESEKAQELLEHCLEHVNPNSGEIAYSLGVMYLEKGLYDKSKSCMDACLNVDDCDVDAMSVQAQACAGLGDTKGEEAWYERLVSTPGAAPEDASKAYCNLGVINQGKEEEIQYYQKSLQLSPSSFAPHYSLGSAYASRQDWDSALSAFRSAVEVAADDSEEEFSALQKLYMVTMNKLEHDNPSGPTSREDMMEKFLNLMGNENYQRLAERRK